MSLLEDLEEASEKRPECSACYAIIAVDNDEKDALKSALKGTIGTQRLSLILRKHGHQVSREMIVKHRREDHQ